MKTADRTAEGAIWPMVLEKAYALFLSVLNAEAGRDLEVRSCSPCSPSFLRSHPDSAQYAVDRICLSSICAPRRYGKPSYELLEPGRNFLGLGSAGAVFQAVTGKPAPPASRLRVLLSPPPLPYCKALSNQENNDDSLREAL
eukprot:SAG11_NODE_26_length_23420_cov_40.459886_5_plen_142_part_00